MSPGHTRRTLKGLLVGLVGLVGLLAAARGAVNTHTLSVTNIPLGGPGTNLVPNGVTRHWTNATTATTILTNLTSTKHATTNLFNAFGAFPQIGVTVSWLTATQLTFRGGDLTLTAAGNWCDISSSSSAGTNLTAIMGPPGNVTTLTNRTNNGNWIIEYASDYTLGKFIKTNAAAFSNFVSIGLSAGGGTQRVYGPKSFDNFQGTNGGFIYDGGVSNVNVSRLNFKPFGAATSATNFGAMVFYDRLTNQVSTLRANSNGIPSMYDSASGASPWHGDELFVTAAVENAAALLNVFSAVNMFPRLAPTALDFSGGSNNWTSANYWNNATNIFAQAPSLPAGFVAWYGGWTGGQLTNGTNYGMVSTNGLFTGTNTWNGDLALTTRAVTSLANGNNAGVVLGTNVSIRLSGASGAHTNCGFAATRDGDFKILRFANPGGMCVVANQSGVEPVAANRIVTGIAGDIVMTNQPAYLEIIYNGTVWEVTRFSR